MSVAIAQLVQAPLDRLTQRRNALTALNLPSGMQNQENVKALVLLASTTTFPLPLATQTAMLVTTIRVEGPPLKNVLNAVQIARSFIKKKMMEQFPRTVQSTYATMMHSMYQRATNVAYA